MPRKGYEEDDGNRKPPKPKEQFRIVLSVYDNGYVDRDLTEFYTNEETGKRKKVTHETPSNFKEAIQKELAENTDKLACWILDAMGIDPNAFARRVGGKSGSYEDDDYADAMDAIEEMEDAEAGADLP